MSNEWRLSWVRALDELELDVAQIEGQLQELHRDRELPLPDPWTPPAGLEPLPLDLTPRADAVLARQLAAALALAEALASTQKQATVAGRLRIADTGPGPSYVDCAL